MPSTIIGTAKSVDTQALALIAALSDPEASKKILQDIISQRAAMEEEAAKLAHQRDEFDAHVEDVTARIKAASDQAEADVRAARAAQQEAQDAYRQAQERIALANTKEQAFISATQSQEADYAAKSEELSQRETAVKAAWDALTARESAVIARERAAMAQSEGIAAQAQLLERQRAAMRAALDVR